MRQKTMEIVKRSAARDESITASRRVDHLLPGNKRTMLFQCSHSLIGMVNSGVAQEVPFPLSELAQAAGGRRQPMQEVLVPLARMVADAKGDLWRGRRCWTASEQ
ncbi:hypothetical protein BDZ91DRAFT_735523 [Kalaharituber pfeilii]|nr:hypothetical protein BDZ91DRAFT_735523 [Kalaharituber pfeilii]